MIAPLPHIEPQLYRAAMEALKKEAQTLASLNHERIVRVYDVFEAQGSVFYVMPWLEGGSLKERMEEADAGGAPITPQQAREWLLHLLDGLEYLHGKGIIHRDIKPGNILFDERGMPVLIDFGAALNKPNASQTISQGEFSYAFAALVQVTAKGEIGPWTDFYSLAATRYALISGNAVEQSLQRLMQDDLTPLAAMKPAPCADKSLLAAIDKNLNLPIAQRCQTAAEWRAMLKRKGGYEWFTPRMIWGGGVIVLSALAVFMWSMGEKESQPEKDGSGQTNTTNSAPTITDSGKEGEKVGEKESGREGEKEDEKEGEKKAEEKVKIWGEIGGEKLPEPEISKKKLLAPASDDDFSTNLPRIELTDRIEPPPPLSAEAEAMHGAVSDYFQWTGRKEIALEKMSKVWETLKEFELWLRGRMIEEAKAVDAIGDPIKYLMIDVKEERWSDKNLRKTWKKNPLYIASQKELKELDSLLEEMSTALYDKDWTESYPTQTEEQRKLVKDIWNYEKRQLSILNGRQKKLNYVASRCMSEAVSRIFHYGMDMCSHYFAKTPVTEEWQIREKYRIDEYLAELNKRKQTRMKEIRAFIDKCRAYYAKVDRVLQGKNSIPELKEWKKSDEYELLEKEGNALWVEGMSINGVFAGDDFHFMLDILGRCESLAPQEERTALQSLLDECNSSRLPINLNMEEGWEYTDRCGLYLERAYKKRMEELR